MIAREERRDDSRVNRVRTLFVFGQGMIGGGGAELGTGISFTLLMETGGDILMETSGSILLEIQF